jgi:hypothetical protein
MCCNSSSVLFARGDVQGTKINSKGKEVPHGTRLYSIASSRYGDEFDGQTASLCVRRAVYVDPETGKEDPAKKGLCSNFLCDAAPGTEIMMTGEHLSCLHAILLQELAGRRWRRRRRNRQYLEAASSASAREEARAVMQHCEQQ